MPTSSSVKPASSRTLHSKAIGRKKISTLKITERIITCGLGWKHDGDGGNQELETNHMWTGYKESQECADSATGRFKKRPVAIENVCFPPGKENSRLPTKQASPCFQRDFNNTCVQQDTIGRLQQRTLRKRMFNNMNTQQMDVHNTTQQSNLPRECEVVVED